MAAKRKSAKSKPTVLEAEVVDETEVSGKQEVLDAEVVSEAEVEVDEDDEAAQALADVAPATDEELGEIEKSLKKASSKAAPSGSTALAVRDPMAAYMAEVRRHPLLTREQEHELAMRWYEDGDAEAGRKLVTSNLRLVVKIANQYRRGYQNLLDLVQEGNVGLVKAVQKFDPHRGNKLSTYAGWWIRAYILKYILNTWRLVKIGTTQNQRKLFFNLRKQQAALQAAGVDPTPEKIAEALDVSTKEVVEMQKRMGAPDASLNAPLSNEDSDGATRMDMLEDSVADPEESVGDDQFKDILHEKLSRFGSGLSGRELEIFTDRLMNNDDPVTLQELGDRWGVSRERARQIEKRMVLRLRTFLQEELGDAVQIALGHDI